MSGESILISVLLRCGLSHLSPQITSDDFQTKEVVDLINETGRDLAQRAQWNVLFQRHDLGTVSGVATLSEVLPDGFLKLSAVTMPDGSQARIIVPDDQWAFIQAGIPTSAYCHIQQGQILVRPGPTEAGAVLRYWSSHWCEAGDALSQNGDAVYLPERVIVSGAVYRWHRKKGLPFDDLMAEHEAQVEAALAADRGMQ